ncbi:hypothetical protein ANANG_G00264770 [Anguilla anguilla]|uniref:Uncharacterized protein n=1 Tax=Anguilla anguilla TaxID=7936 RepID=A0A9D3LPW7_ANGAN|nr:hypothetical protein ANANG_G00264770 [Anguilla anguilla]
MVALWECVCRGEGALRLFDIPELTQTALATRPEGSRAWPRSLSGVRGRSPALAATSSPVAQKQVRLRSPASLTTSLPTETSRTLGRSVREDHCELCAGIEALESELLCAERFHGLSQGESPC